MLYIPVNPVTLCHFPTMLYLVIFDFSSAYFSLESLHQPVSSQTYMYSHDYERILSVITALGVWYIDGAHPGPKTDRDYLEQSNIRERKRGGCRLVS